MVGPYKVAWIKGDKLYSQMCDDKLTAEQIAQDRPGMCFTMRLEQSDSDGGYEWRLVPGFWRSMLQVWPILLILNFAVIGYLIAKK